MPKEEIAKNDYDLSLNRYKEVEHEAVEYDPPKVILERLAALEAEIAKLEEYLSAPDLYQQAPLKFQKASAALVERQTALQSAEDEWLTLEEKNAS